MTERQSLNKSTRTHTASVDQKQKKQEACRRRVQRERELDQDDPCKYFDTYDAEEDYDRMTVDQLQRMLNAFPSLNEDDVNKSSENVQIGGRCIPVVRRQTACPKQERRTLKRFVAYQHAVENADVDAKQTASVISVQQIVRSWTAALLSGQCGMHPALITTADIMAKRSPAQWGFEVFRHKHGFCVISNVTMGKCLASLLAKSGASTNGAHWDTTQPLTPDLQAIFKSYFVMPLSLHQAGQFKTNATTEEDWNSDMQRRLAKLEPNCQEFDKDMERRLANSQEFDKDMARRFAALGSDAPPTVLVLTTEA
jgi:hypothetical protein